MRSRHWTVLFVGLAVLASAAVLSELTGSEPLASAQSAGDWSEPATAAPHEAVSRAVDDEAASSAGRVGTFVFVAVCGTVALVVLLVVADTRRSRRRREGTAQLSSTSTASGMG